MHDNDPYSAPAAPLATEVPHRDLVLADRLLRLVAVMIDGMLAGLLFLPILFGAMFQAGLFSGAPDPRLFEYLQGGMGYLLQVGMVAAGFLLFALLQGYPLSRYGQTWGKRWLGMRIVDMEGNKPDFLRMLLLRYGLGQLISVIPCLGPLFGLTDALFVFRDDRRCVHDLIAGTQVVVGSPDA